MPCRGGFEQQVAQAVAGDRSTAQRIRLAYATGELSIDDAARYSLYSALDPDRVPEAYRAEDPAAVDEPLDILGWWDELQPETREELAPYLEVRPAPESQSFDQGDGEWQDCSGRGWILHEVSFACATSTDVDGDGDADFTIYYTVGAVGVPADDSNGNQRPDLIDLVERSARQAWAVYAGMGFTAPDAVDIVMDPVMLPGAGLALPFNRTIYLDTDPNRVTPFLPRHELFHQFQYEHVGTPEIAAHFDAMIWWMEATANWAAGQANAAASADLRVNGHVQDLPEVLGEPELRLDEARGWVGGAEYGAFVVAEYLAERFDGPATIGQTWERIGEGALGRNPTDVVADALAQGGSFADELMRYRQWTYVLTSNQGIGFTTPDVDRYWRGVLADDRRTTAKTEAEARPRRVEHDVPVNRLGPDGFTPLDPTGATYADLTVPPDATELEITVATDSTDVDAALLRFSDYPELCGDPLPLTRDADADLTITLTPDPACPTHTLVIANTSRATPHSVFWSAWARAPELELRGDGLADDISIGDQVQPTIDAITAALGQPTDDTGWVQGCPLDGEAANERYVTFGDLSVTFYDDSGVRTFVNWAYGPGDAHMLRTARDIGPGSTNAELAQAYAEAMYEDGTFGPMWTIPEPAGGPMFAFPVDDGGTTPIGTLYGGTRIFCE